MPAGVHGSRTHLRPRNGRTTVLKTAWRSFASYRSRLPRFTTPSNLRVSVRSSPGEFVHVGVKIGVDAEPGLIFTSASLQRVPILVRLHGAGYAYRLLAAMARLPLPALLGSTEVGSGPSGRNGGGLQS